MDKLQFFIQTSVNTMKYDVNVVAYKYLLNHRTVEIQLVLLSSSFLNNTVWYQFATIDVFNFWKYATVILPIRVYMYGRSILNKLPRNNYRSFMINCQPQKDNNTTLNFKEFLFRARRTEMVIKAYVFNCDVKWYELPCHRYKIIL